MRVGVEGADGVDLVVEQVHAIGLERAHGEQIDQAAAHRVFAMADHLGHMLVAGQRELGLEFGFVQLLTLLELKGIAGQKRGRGQAIKGRGGGHDDHIGTMLLVALVDAPQRGQALADQILVRREAVVGQGFPVGKQCAAQLGAKKAISSMSRWASAASAVMMAVTRPSCFSRSPSLASSSASALPTGRAGESVYRGELGQLHGFSQTNAGSDAQERAGCENGTD